MLVISRHLIKFSGHYNTFPENWQKKTLTCVSFPPLVFCEFLELGLIRINSCWHKLSSWQYHCFFLGGAEASVDVEIRCLMCITTYLHSLFLLSTTFPAQPSVKTLLQCLYFLTLLAFPLRFVFMCKSKMFIQTRKWKFTYSASQMCGFAADKRAASLPFHNINSFSCVR